MPKDDFPGPETDSSDGQQPRMISISAEEWERVRAEQDRLQSEVIHNLKAYYDTLSELNAQHLKLVNAEASESNWRAVARKYKLVLLEIYASGSPDDRFWQLAMNVLLGEGDDWRKI